MATRTSNLIVLSGEAGAGKDSVADILVDSHGYEKFSLSTEMKVFCGKVFGFSDDQLYGPSNFRNAPDPRWARPCQVCSGKGLRDAYFGMVLKKQSVFCDTCQGTGKINDNSPRRILQLLGDEWSRQMIHPDIWTMTARPLLEAKLAGGARIVINDARFDNDRANLAEWVGASLVDVRTVRKKSRKKTEAWRQHGSETERPTDDAVHRIIKNDEEWPFPSLPKRVEEMLHGL
jgi:hypothetical protein